MGVYVCLSMNLKALGVQDRSYLNPSPRFIISRDFPLFFKFSCIVMNMQVGYYS